MLAAHALSKYSTSILCLVTGLSSRMVRGAEHETSIAFLHDFLALPHISWNATSIVKRFVSFAWDVRLLIR